MDDSQRFQAALACFDEENARDPHLVIADGIPQPHELLYARRVSEWVLRLCPEASQALLLAARCQHICRWLSPRSSYEMTRPGYLRWRADLKHFHAHKTADILLRLGFPEATIARVLALNLKQGLGSDPELQVLEDALCLVTLQYQLSDLVRKTEPTKMISILQKTWRKMSPAAHEHALKLPYSETERQLLEQALAPPARS